MASLQVPGSALAREANREQSPARTGARVGSTQYAAPPLGALKRVGTSRDISKPGAADDAAAAKQAVDSTSEIEVLLTSEEAKNDPLKDANEIVRGHVLIVLWCWCSYVVLRRVVSCCRVVSYRLAHAHERLNSCCIELYCV